LWQKDFEEKNKDSRSKYHKKYREENREHLNACARKNEKANPEKYQARRKKYIKKNLEKIAKRASDYRKANPEIFRYYTAKRLLAQLQRTPSWLTDFDNLKIKCIYQVAAMRTKESGQSWDVDHIIPLRGKVVSGLHVPSNLQVITTKENRQKNNNYIVS